MNEKNMKYIGEKRCYLCEYLIHSHIEKCNKYNPSGDIFYCFYDKKKINSEPPNKIIKCDIFKYDRF
jgi:hypothetical protein